jgi:cyclopropane fatty-acyl-phospholipid synthase-like methyltransferase
MENSETPSTTQIRTELSSWEGRHASDSYFDCGRNYAEDLRARFDDKSPSVTQSQFLIGCGLMSGQHNGRTLNAIVELPKVGKEWKTLEIGSGYGGVGALVAPYVASYSGVDISPTIVERGNQAIAKAGIPNMKLYPVSNCNLAIFPDGSFDMIFNTGVFIHTPPEITKSYLCQTARKLRRGGHFVFHFNMTAEESSFHQDYVHYYRQEEFAEIFRGSGLRLTATLDDTEHAPKRFLRYAHGVSD